MRDGGEEGEVVLMAIKEVVVGETPKRRNDSAIWWGVSMPDGGKIGVEAVRVDSKSA